MGKPAGMLLLAVAMSLFLLTASFPGSASARTLVLEGDLDSRIGMTQRMSFAVDKPVAKLEFTFALPATFSNKAVTQRTDNLRISFDPEPVAVEDLTDSFGNTFRKVSWQHLTSDATVSLSYRTSIHAVLSAMESRAPFPLTDIPGSEARFLKPTAMVQADNPEVIDLGRSLTSGATTEFQAVNAILNHVADTVKYSYNPKQYDALYTLETGSGNCQNFAHVSMALLRAVGIPSRIVGGISLKEPWKVPLDQSSSLVQSMGQGGHAWMEIWFPDLGWLSYDPQQSKQFTSTRHIKQTHGLDSRDVNDSWTASPYLPRYSETIEAKYAEDAVALKMTGALSEPRPYLLSNNLTGPKGAELPTVLPGPAKPPAKPVPPPRKPTEWFEFGNRDFPTLVDTYQVSGNRGEKILDQETSAYATSKNVYAQAMLVENPIEIDSISLALHKFGGDGSLYLDLVADDGGKPSISTGHRSRPVFLDSVPRKPGYYWVNFSFAPDRKGPLLKKGKYWIILRHSGDAIVNWFYIPGKPYSSGDDTRSTAKGYKWEDILNCDFVFKARARDTGSIPAKSRHIGD